MEKGSKGGVDSTLRPPLAPMLARLDRELPSDGYLYEPKWDGFRGLAFRAGEEVDLRSRNQRPLARYFPELVEALLGLPAERYVLDGEIVAISESRPDFVALLARLHSAASRVERLSRETPALFIAFDLLALEDDDLRARPFRERRAVLERLLAEASPPLLLTPLTDDRPRAEHWLEAYQGVGVDGVVAKHEELRYEEGARRMVKVKRERTADCVVAGFRWLVDRQLPSSMPTVATPVAWEEVERAASEGRPEVLTLLAEDVIERLDRHGDLFAGVLELEQSLPAP